jgi:electron transport complex protein RnfC
MKFQEFSKFPGGVHPTDGLDKRLSNQESIFKYIPEVVEISMKQSGGSACEVVVKQGDHVTIGQIIGEPKGFGAAAIHASMNGTVIEIKIVKDAKGQETTVCVIQAEETKLIENELEYSNKLIDLTDISKERIIGAMKDSGLIGMGGAGFPTHIKYETNKKIQYVLINGAECEPFLTCDHRLMLEYGMEIVNGANLLVKAADATKGIICLEDNKKDAAEHLKKLLGDVSSSLEVKVLPTKYPQGGERQLVQAVTGIEVPMGGLPADVGIIISNVATAKAIADMIFAQIPLVSRCITITGRVKKPRNYLVPIGTKFSDLIELSGGFEVTNNRLILGGPMTGACLAINVKAEELEGSVTKTSSGIVVLENNNEGESPCIRCEACARVCPAGIVPFKINHAYIDENIDICEKLYATECIGCGSCSYVCPAKIELAYRVMEARGEINRRKRERGVK